MRPSDVDGIYGEKHGNEQLLSIERRNAWNVVHGPVDNVGQAMNLPSRNEYQVATSGEFY